MGIENFQRWHWIVIGASLGLFVGLWQMFTTNTFGPDFDVHVDRTMDQVKFEQTLLAPNGDGEFIYGPVTVHPPDSDGVMWVTGYATRPVSQRERNEPRRAFLFMFGAKVPYIPLKDRGKPPADPNQTVVHFLDQMKAAAPTAEISYRIAWWETPKTRIALTTGVGVTVVGLIWPTVLNLLTGTGYSRPRRRHDDYDLSRFSSAPEADKAASASLFAGGRDAAMGDATAQDASTPAPKSEPLSDQHQRAPGLQEKKEYKGEYYPVARSKTPKE